jgi:hypothetical protein
VLSLENIKMIYLVTVTLGWIMAEAERGTVLDDITVTSIATKGRPTNVKLNKDIWARSLLRGPTKSDFYRFGTYSLRIWQGEETVCAWRIILCEFFLENGISYARCRKSGVPIIIIIN